ncbi:hypothetical protein [Parapedobacter indicus]|uniref:CarboxypepD_reg-like domain-containing protein n=1 Tax=Parapedobacter indicus TaxID=1477437 RepID=A0A1I3M714_9SPHI|nr:hypothetical protein [Parapedobacter indicus]PPL01263.1 hypothetical protein CLV26_10672 [Parapedobacter indicus]SFI92620.1 hypothetical protein SAMN05444682_106263 [Parapedobacter indicus]
MAVRIQLTCFFLFLAATVSGQGYLMRDVHLRFSDPQRIQQVLDAIGKAHDFYFSYSNQVVPADSLITVARYDGKLLDFLTHTLGPAYEFKETPGYVIIRYAPRRMVVAIDIEERRHGPMVIEGQITDADHKKGVYLASVYERNVLASTLSGPAGNFKLTIKRPEETIWLTISKENYRDTTLALLPPVQVNNRQKGRRYWFAPDEGSGMGLDGTALGRFFTSSRQRIQRINLGGFFAYNPYQISLTPGLSSQGLFNSQVVNQVSVNIVGGHTAGVNGVEVGGVFNINQQQARYFQAAGLFNLVGNGVQGVQAAGISNIVVRDVSGVQVAGINNRARNVVGAQLVGLFNVAENIQGIQLAGIVNIAGKVNGVQLSGLVNVADSSDYPIGLINLIKNGDKSFAIELNESGVAQLTFRSGGRILYGLLGVGYRLNDSSMRYVLEAGIGVHIWQTNRFALDTELASRISPDFKTTPEQQASFRVFPQFRFNPHWGIFAGPSVNYLLQPNRTFQAGLMGGVRYRW